MTDQGHRLVLRDEGAQDYRHYLNDTPVHAGDMLELRLDGSWIPGRYEWVFDPKSPPTFHTDNDIIGLASESALRWPE